MTAISGTLTSTTPSASFTPTQTMSDVMVMRNGEGDIFLEAKEPVTNKWHLVGGYGNYAVATPDPAVLYRFRAEGQNIDFDYYMGP